ncbi:Fanconi anemia group F protein [Bombina bombina]|uniref:Fanconi anemia group F protein n=1 Tax=Bombina bombina TaxID=8345 RepID=UPI00235A6A15|nr:Fanconi anemia group F protein [Bombina bombina]
MPGKLATMLDNLDHFVEVLTLAQSIQVKDLDILSVKRAFEWSTYFRHVYHRFESNETVRHAIENHLLEKNKELNSYIKSYKFIMFKDLEKSEEILYMSLLQNKGIPNDILKYLVTQFTDATSQDSKLHGVNRVVTQKAACQLLLSLTSVDPVNIQNSLDNPIVLTQTEMLRSTLEERIKTLEENQQLAALSDILSAIPQPQGYYLLLAMLDSKESDKYGWLSHLILDWLLDDSARCSGFCSNISPPVLSRLASRYPQLVQAYLDILTNWGASMEMDFAHGMWVSPIPSLSFSVLLDHFQCLLLGPKDLKTATDTTLKRLKHEDGDYNVPGLSIWTDLLLELKKI